MKLEVKRRDNGMVEIHLKEEDGKLVVYLCEDGQAAIFKLAQLLFQMGDDPKENRRSILVGEFTKKEKKPSLHEKMKDILKELKKAGFVPADAQKTVPYQPYVPTPLPASPQIDPNVVPITTTPYGTGTQPYTITWGTYSTDSSGGITYTNSGGTLYFNTGGQYFKLNESPVTDGSGSVNAYNVSYSAVTP